MSDLRIDKLKGLLDLLNDKKALKEYAGQIDESTLDIGFYAYPEGKNIKVEEFKELKKILALRKEHGAKLVKATSQQVATLREVLSLEKDDKFKIGVEAVKNYKDNTDIRGLPVSFKAAASAYANFEASWSGIKAEVGLKSGVEVTYGKEGKFQYTAGLAAAAKAYAEVKRSATSLSVEVGAEAVGEATHTLKSGTIKLLNSSYDISFYCVVKAFAKAEAKATAGINLNLADKKVVFGASATAYAGFGVSGEVGVNIHGVYGRDKNTRVLAIVDAILAVEIGIGVTASSIFTANETEINGQTYIKRSVQVAADFFAGGSINVEFALLKEIEGDFKAKIEAAVKEKVLAIIGEDIYNSIKEKYTSFKEGIKTELTYSWNVIYGKTAGLIKGEDSYGAVQKKLENHVIRLTERIHKLEKDPNSAETKEKLEKQLEEYNNLLSRNILSKAIVDMEEIVEHMNAIHKSDDLTKTILSETEKLEDIILRIEGVTRINAEIAFSAQTIGKHVTEEDQVMLNLLLNTQEYIHQQLDEVIRHIKDVILKKPGA